MHPHHKQGIPTQSAHARTFAHHDNASTAYSLISGFAHQTGRLSLRFTPATHLLRFGFICLLAIILVSCLTACGGNASGQSSATGETSGAAFEQPEALVLSPFNKSAATKANDTLIDTSHIDQGYVAVSATSSARLKFEITHDGMSYYYDLPNNGTPIACPLNMGNGTYTFCVWENTSGTRYVAMSDPLSASVSLDDEFQPFIRPNLFCDFDESSESTRLANELCADAENEGDALRAICEWVINNVEYDEQKAASLTDATGYIPNPDETIASKSGICFDYASLVAAMLRSQGIPCKIVTGEVAPDGIYHAWNMVYINGTWVTVDFSIEENTWTRMDTTFAAGGSSNYVGDGSSYTDRYIY